MSEQITVLGSTGFIGSRVQTRLLELGYDPFCPGRDERLTSQRLGTVVYCVGLTADFREDPLGSYNAHLGLLRQLLVENSVERVVYLSSARVYLPLLDAQSDLARLTEDLPIPVLSSSSSDVYTLSKLAGESLVLATGPANTALRLSNVVGPPAEMGSFLGQVVAEIKSTGQLHLRSHPQSAKDYISVGAVVETITMTLRRRMPGVYNVCNGFNLSNQDWLDLLAQHFAFELQVDDTCRPVVYPPISHTLLTAQTGFVPETRDAVFAALELHGSSRPCDQEGGK